MFNIKEFEERAKKSREEMRKIWKEKRDIERQFRELGWHAHSYNYYTNGYD